MKLAVCTIHVNDWYTEIVKYSIRNMQTYCKKHDYTFIHQSEHSPNTVYNEENLKIRKESTWFKIPLLKQILTENKDIDVVVWIDADSNILNMGKKLEHYIDTYMVGKDFLFGSENNTVLNGGVVFVRNTEFSIKFLDETWTNKRDFDHNFHEQASMANLYTENVFNCQNHITILPAHKQNEFLSYWFMYYPKQCFIMHAARCSHDREGFIFTMDVFCPIRLDEENDDQYNKRMEWLHTETLCRKTIDGWQNGKGGRTPSARNAIGYR